MGMKSTEQKENQVMSDRALAALGAPQTVYMREIAAKTAHDELARLVQDQNVTLEIDPDQKLYALHAADGTRLAIVNSRGAALQAAWENEMTLVAVH
jgi:hypothetical protein